MARIHNRFLFSHEGLITLSRGPCGKMKRASWEGHKGLMEIHEKTLVLSRALENE